MMQMAQNPNMQWMMQNGMIGQQNGNMQMQMPMYAMPPGGMQGGGQGGQRSYTPQGVDQSGNPYASRGSGGRSAR